MTFDGKPLIEPRYITQGDIDYSLKALASLNQELLDESPGSVRAMLEDLFDDGLELPGEPTDPDEVDYNFIHGKVIEYINDIRGGRQTILIVTAIENKALFNSLYTSPPWLNEQADLPPDQTAFTLMKKVNSSANKIFCLNEDIQSTKNLLKNIKEAKTSPPKPVKAARKPVIGPFFKNLWDNISDDVWYGGRSVAGLVFPEIGIGAEAGYKFIYGFVDIGGIMALHYANTNYQPDNDIFNFYFAGGLGFTTSYWDFWEWNLDTELRWYKFNSDLITEGSIKLFFPVFELSDFSGRVGLVFNLGFGKEYFTSKVLAAVFQIRSNDF
ncbi:hypothetical protein FACS189491_03880 [Spirochaetia bacterium]|nr:hypothetical protein FACS189491_03880 [Spirochaetia bacterium]